MNLIYFGIIIDHDGKRIIHGDKSSIVQVENYTGLQAMIYNTHFGYEAELKRAEQKYSDYRRVKANFIDGLSAL